MLSMTPLRPRISYHSTNHQGGHSEVHAQSSVHVHVRCVPSTFPPHTFGTEQDTTCTASARSARRNTWKNSGMSLVQPPSCPQTQGASSSMVPRLRVLMSMILPTTSTHQSGALLRTVPGRPAVRALQVPRTLQIGCERSVPCARAELSPGHSAAARHPVCGPGPHTCERLFANVRVPPRVVGKNGLKRMLAQP